MTLCTPVLWGQSQLSPSSSNFLNWVLVLSNLSQFGPSVTLRPNWMTELPCASHVRCFWGQFKKNCSIGGAKSNFSFALQIEPMHSLNFTLNACSIMHTMHPMECIGSIWSAYINSLFNPRKRSKLYIFILLVPCL